jgi:hypothetical protein
MATVLLSEFDNAFYGICMSEHLGALTSRSVHPASPVLLTMTGPLETGILTALGSIKHPKGLTYSKFENGRRALRPPLP